MRNRLRRAVAVLLMAALMLTSVPMSAFADEAETATMMIGNTEEVNSEIDRYTEAEDSPEDPAAGGQEDPAETRDKDSPEAADNGISGEGPQESPADPGEANTPENDTPPAEEAEEDIEGENGAEDSEASGSDEQTEAEPPSEVSEKDANGEEEEESAEEEETAVPVTVTVCLGDVRDLIRIERSGEVICTIYGNPSPGSGAFFLAGPSGLEPLSADGDGLTRVTLEGMTGDLFAVSVLQPPYADIGFSRDGEGNGVTADGVARYLFTADGDTSVSVYGDYSDAEGYYAVPRAEKRLLAASSSWTLPNTLYVSLGQAYDTYSSNAVVNGHRGVYFFQPEELGSGRFVSATCGSTTKSMVSGVHTKAARIADSAARAYLDYGSGCCRPRAQRALAWITHHGQSEYDWNRANNNQFVMGDGKLWVQNQLEAYTITFLAAWVCTNDMRAGTYGTVYAEDGAHALDFMFGSGFTSGLPASTRSAIDRMVAWGLAFADAHPDGNENVDEYQMTYVYTDGNGAHQPLLVGAYQGPSVPTTGTVSVAKISSDAECTSGNGMYSFAGTQFSVKDGSGNTVGTLTADAMGRTGKLELEPGTYTVTETKAGEGYLLSTEIRTVTLEAGDEKTVTFANEPMSDPMVFGIYKVDAETGERTPQGDGTMAGARYRYDYYDNEDWSGTPFRSWVFETDDDGKIEYAPEYKVEGPDLFSFDDWTYMPLGTLKITEVEAPRGYTMETREILMKMTKNGTSVETKLTDETGTWVQAQANLLRVPEKADRGGVRFKKTDLDTGAPVAGAEISVYSTAQNDVVTAGILRKKGEAAAVLITGEDGTCETAEDCLPFGTYFAVETKAAPGYEINREWRAEFTITGGGAILDLTGEETVLKDRIIRGDLRLRKTDENGAPMPYVPFLIIALDGEGKEAESHVMLTDGQGILDTGLFPDKRDNHLDARMDRGTYRGDPSDDAAGVWFGPGEPSGELGALPYGKYRLVELRTDEMLEEGFNLIETETVEITRPHVTVELPGAVDRRVKMTSRARSQEGDSFLSGEETENITDMVTIEGLTPGRTYRLKTDFVLRDAPGTLVGTGEQEFTAPEGGKAEVTVNVSADLGPVTEPIAAIDSLYEEIHGETVFIAEHVGLSEKDQTLWRPLIHTDAGSAGSYADEVQAAEKAEIADTVRYEGLKPGETYTVFGILMDKGTGEAVVKDGIAVTASRMFIPESEDGEIEVIFTFDGTSLAGRTLVVFEELICRGRIIAEHTDIEDKDQSVNVIDIRTLAKDSATGTRQALLSREETIIDTVIYEGLTPGEPYYLRGEIMVKATGRPLTRDGSPVTSTAVFVPGSPDGTAEVRFTVDTEGVQGQDLVVFEALYREDPDRDPDSVPVAVHTDLNDEGQTIHVPVRPGNYVNTGDTGEIRRWITLFGLSVFTLGNLLLCRRKMQRERKKRNG